MGPLYPHGPPTPSPLRWGGGAGGTLSPTVLPGERGRVGTGLRRQAVNVAREEGCLADVGDVQQPRYPALQPQGATAVRRHPMAEGGQVALERLVGQAARVERRQVLVVAV